MGVGGVHAVGSGAVWLHTGRTRLHAHNVRRLAVPLHPQTQCHQRPLGEHELRHGEENYWDRSKETSFQVQ